MDYQGRNLLENPAFPIYLELNLSLEENQVKDLIKEFFGESVSLELKLSEIVGSFMTEEFLTDVQCEYSSCEPPEYSELYLDVSDDLIQFVESLGDEVEIARKFSKYLNCEVRIADPDSDQDEDEDCLIIKP